MLYTTTSSNRSSRSNNNDDAQRETTTPVSRTNAAATAAATITATSPASNVVKRMTATRTVSVKFPSPSETAAVAGAAAVAGVTTQQQQQRQLQQSTTSLGMSRDSKYILSALFAGVGSGAVASITCAPLDLIRTRLQVWGDLSKSKSKPNVMVIVKDILRQDGWTGCFRGLGASLVTVPFFWGVYFPLYDETKRQWSSKYPEQSAAVVHCGSAVLAGAVSDLICNPLFVIRTRLQTEALHHLMEKKGTAGRKLNMIQTMQSLYKEGGYPIFWRGMTANIIGLSHVAVQFPVYERLKQMLLQFRYFSSAAAANNEPPKTKNSVLDLLLASGLSKMTAMFLTYPHEVIRSRMMDSRGTKGHGLIEVSTRIYQKEGLKGFYSGLPISLVRVVPNCCITFMTYELLLRYGKEHLFS